MEKPSVPSISRCKWSTPKNFRNERAITKAFATVWRFPREIYTSLREQYIIFLCPMDIFGHGFPVYHFENRAREDANITLNDLTFKNFYIFRKYEEFDDPVVKAYMKYFATKDADSRETETINDQVSFYKADTLIRNKYMTYEFDLHESKEEGRAEAKAEAKRLIQEAG